MQFKVNGTSAQCCVVQGWRATYRVGMGHRDVHTNGDDGYRMESAENPWVWAQMLREWKSILRESRGDGRQIICKIINQIIHIAFYIHSFTILQINYV